jgi:hypothetical protein
MLTDIFAVGFNPELSHQRRIELLEEGVVASRSGIGRSAHEEMAVR